MKAGGHLSEASESQILVASAFELARNLGIPRILVLADLITDRRTVEQARQNETVIWLTHGGERESYPEIRGGDACIALPPTALGRLDQVKLGLTLAVLQRHVDVDTSVVCLTGVAGSKRLDMLAIINASRDFPCFRGREGKPVGAIFVLGDPNDIEPHTRQLIFNPCKGHAHSVRNIHNPEFFETLRELTALDGAFLVDERGVVARAGAYLDAPASKKIRVRRGLGARHVAAAAMTAHTDALSLVISESSGNITVFARGAALLELEKPPPS
ncbi:MAG TPA: diadenylate cyclase [Polyangiales bacterium]|nr:diadenylate cyclase [Polyangiales bacterium]